MSTSTADTRTILMAAVKSGAPHYIEHRARDGALCAARGRVAAMSGTHLVVVFSREGRQMAIPLAALVSVEPSQRSEARS